MHELAIGYLLSAWRRFSTKYQDNSIKWRLVNPYETGRKLVEQVLLSLLACDIAEKKHAMESFRKVFQVALLQWLHNERNSVSNHQPHGCLLNLLFRRSSKKTSKPRVMALSEGVNSRWPVNSLVTDEFLCDWWIPGTNGQLRGKHFHLTTSSCCITHWGRVAYICVSKLIIIGSDNGLSPSRCQAIIWTNAGILLIRILGTNFSEILSEIHAFWFKKMHLKMSSAKWRPFCLGLNVLIGPACGYVKTPAQPHIVL